jgi:hypothetical protein
MKSNLLTIVTGAFLTAGAVSFAQTTAAPALTFTSFTEESVISPDQATSTNAPAFSDDVVALIQGGGYELHQQVAYDSVAATVTVIGFLLPSGSPVPTAAVPNNAAIYSYVFKVTSMTNTETAAMLSGTVESSDGAGAFASLTGGLATLTTGLALQSPDSTGTSAASFNAVDVVIAGIGGLMAPTGQGAVKIKAVKGLQIPIAVAGPKGQQVSTPSFTLSGAASKDPSGGTLTYKWVFMPVAGQTLTINGASTATPAVVLGDPSATGVYAFQLTVTNAAGLIATDVVSIDYEVQ